MGRVKGMGCRVAECMRWERDGRTDSRRRTCVAPESARIGDGMMEHKRAGVGKLLSDASSSESSDSNAAN